ncbi:ATP-binding cassette domain-containing protein [Leucobacter sp. L43]|uniref:ABC transporter ATP-binding protein n=1 Tax=Leucobacter sp. L43 TaxID=2798040 RepID=UPI00190338DB|nr:ATP-binding cassette domain-containing protein [Leucobacter sp. L43]
MIVVQDAEVREREVTLLSPTSFAAAGGDAVVVRGANGSGKSTLLRLVAGLRSPSSGTVSIDGRDAASRDPHTRRSVAAMIGMPPLAPDLTVRDHVLLVATTWSASGRDAERLTCRVLDELDLSPLATRFPHELSSGQTQLFGLALVLARPSDALVLDEPEQRLDVDRIGLVVGAVNRRRESGAAVVVATHSDVLEAGIGGRTLWLQGAA